MAASVNGQSPERITPCLDDFRRIAHEASQGRICFDGVTHSVGIVDPADRAIGDEGYALARSSLHDAMVREYGISLTLLAERIVLKSDVVQSRSVVAPNCPASGYLSPKQLKELLEEADTCRSNVAGILRPDSGRSYILCKGVSAGHLQEVLAGDGCIMSGDREATQPLFLTVVENGKNLLREAIDTGDVGLVKHLLSLGVLDVLDFEIDSQLIREAKSSWETREGGDPSPAVVMAEWILFCNKWTPPQFVKWIAEHAQDLLQIVLEVAMRDGLLLSILRCDGSVVEGEIQQLSQEGRKILQALPDKGLRLLQIAVCDPRIANKVEIVDTIALSEEVLHGLPDVVLPIVAVAVRLNNPLLITALANAGASLEGIGEALELIIDAASQNRPEVIIALSDIGARFNEADERGAALIRDTAVRNRPELVSALGVAGASLRMSQDHGSGLLRNSLVEGNERMSKVLIEAGALFDSSMEDLVAMMKVLLKEQEDRCAFCRAQRREVSAKDEKDIEILLRGAIDSCQEVATHIIKWAAHEAVSVCPIIFNSGVSPKLLNADETLMLIRNALAISDSRAIYSFAEAGGELTGLPDGGETCLEIALRQGDAQCAMALRQCGARKMHCSTGNAEVVLNLIRASRLSGLIDVIDTSSEAIAATGDRGAGLIYWLAERLLSDSAIDRYDGGRKAIDGVPQTARTETIHRMAIITFLHRLSMAGVTFGETPDAGAAVLRAAIRHPNYEELVVPIVKAGARIAHDFDSVCELFKTSIQEGDHNRVHAISRAGGSLATASPGLSLELIKAALNQRNPRLLLAMVRAGLRMDVLSEAQVEEVSAAAAAADVQYRQDAKESVRSIARAITDREMRLVQSTCELPNLMLIRSIALVNRRYVRRIKKFAKSKYVELLFRETIRKLTVVSVASVGEVVSQMVSSQGSAVAEAAAYSRSLRSILRRRAVVDSQECQALIDRDDSVDDSLDDVTFDEELPGRLAPLSGSRSAPSSPVAGAAGSLAPMGDLMLREPSIASYLRQQISDQESAGAAADSYPAFPAPPDRGRRRETAVPAGAERPMASQGCGAAASESVLLCNAGDDDVVNFEGM